MIRFETRTVQDVTETLIDYRGKTPPKSDIGIRLVTAKVIKDGFIQDDRAEYVSEETYESWMRRGYPQTSDIVITTEAPLGEVAQIRTSERLALAQRVILLRGNPNVIDQQFFFQALRSPFVQAGLSQRATGTTVSGIKQSELRQVRVPYPPLPTQHKIAAILSANDDLIENNLRRIKILEEMAQMIYREWFVHFRFPGYEKVKMVDSPLGRIPEGWEVRNLFAIADVTYGFPFTSHLFNDTGVGRPIIRIRDIVASETSTFTTEDVADKYLVTNGDILIGMDGDFHMGVWSGGRAFLVQRVSRLRPKGDIGPYHLFWALRTPIRNFNAAISGTTVAHLGDKHLREIQILWPSPDLISRARQLLDAFLEQVLGLRVKNRILRRTRDLLLPKLISGEIDVSNLDIDTGRLDE